LIWEKPAEQHQRQRQSLYQTELNKRRSPRLKKKLNKRRSLRPLWRRTLELELAVSRSRITTSFWRSLSKPSPWMLQKTVLNKRRSRSTTNQNSDQKQEYRELLDRLEK
jgi:hypothetical protein